MKKLYIKFKLIFIFIPIVTIIFCKNDRRGEIKKRINLHISEKGPINYDSSKTKTTHSQHFLNLNKFYAIKNIYLIDDAEKIEKLFLLNTDYTNSLEKNLNNKLPKDLINIVKYFLSPLGNNTNKIENFIFKKLKNNLGFIIITILHENIFHKVEKLPFNNSFHIVLNNLFTGVNYLDQKASIFQNKVILRNYSELPKGNCIIGDLKFEDFFNDIKAKEDSLGSVINGGIHLSSVTLNENQKFYRISRPLTDEKYYLSEINEKIYPLCYLNNNINSNEELKCPFINTNLNNSTNSYITIEFSSSIYKNILFYFEVLKIGQESKYLKSINFAYDFVTKFEASEKKTIVKLLKKRKILYFLFLIISILIPLLYNCYIIYIMLSKNYL